MPTLPPFRLEAYFSRWEFAAKYHLTASDAESMSVGELVSLADDDVRTMWDGLRLGYTQTFGLPALREEIAATYSSVAPENVICFAGAEEPIYLAMQVLLDRDDHAVVITPNYQAAETVPLSICEVTGVPLRPEDGWALDVDAVIAALRPNTRVVSVCFPNNPTGAVPDERVWRELLAVCDERSIRVFSDEVFRGLELPPRSPLPQAADVSPNAISLNVMSKAYGLPGLRIGWIASRDDWVVRSLERAKHYTTICNAAPSEVLALAALRARERILERNRRIIGENLPMFDDFFARYTDLFEWEHPAGGCVSFPRYTGPDGVEEMCVRLVEEEGVLLLPASVFTSALAATPDDRFRIGVGRRNPMEPLERWSAWLDKRR